MNITCRTGNINITLPNEKTRIGVLVSGGIDSALLYYLVLKEKQDTNSNHEIFPIIMFRKEGSKYFARPIVEKINNLFNISIRAKRFGDESLPDDKQIESLVIQASDILRLEEVYIGVIKNRPEHTIGLDQIPIPINDIIKTPFIDLEKDCIIKLFYDYNIEHLLEYTHSCDKNEQVPCEVCNGCRERLWGFNFIEKNDPVLP